MNEIMMKMNCSVLLGTPWNPLNDPWSMAVADDYFHYRLTCLLLFFFLIDCLAYKIS